jgi:hypothetical protein
MACANVFIELNYIVPGQGVQTLEVGHRLQGTITYTTQTVTLQAGPAPTFQIQVPCNTGNCDGIIYEGYIKNLCGDQPEIPWTALVVDTDEVDCYQFQWECSAVGIDSVTPDGSGLNYAVGDELVFTGGGGTGAQGTVSAVDGNGAPTAYTISNSGSDYTSAPTVSIDPVVSGTGAGATATAVLGNCPAIDHGYCSGVTTTTMEMALGESFIECNTVTQFNDKVANLTQAQRDSLTYLNIGTSCACATCKELTVTNLDLVNPVTITYNICATGELVVQEILAGATYISPCEVICETVSAITPNPNISIDGCAVTGSC